MRNLAPLLLLFVLSMALVISQGEAQGFWTWPKPKPKNLKPLVSADCIKAKLALSTCIKEKLASPWYRKPLVHDCCKAIGDLEKTCPKIIAKFDERLIPPFIKDVCFGSAPGPSTPSVPCPTA